MLSWGFCLGEASMLVCGVLDNAASVKDPYCNGRFRVEKQSDEVLRVGDAMVIFNAKRVAPLFVATRYAQPVSHAVRHARIVKAISQSSGAILARRRHGAHMGPMTRLVKFTVRKSAEAFLLRHGAKKRR